MGYMESNTTQGAGMDYEMYSRAGNRAVSEALKPYLDEARLGVSGAFFEQAAEAVSRKVLAQGYREVTDTAVREAIYYTLLNAK